ncbi:MAG TPA: argininosuccinate lyase [Candidatus Deferrimicrobium sp.]|nr:argininosuccinate lyase [Candidatus Deferrimicrobium sp.]
MSRKIVGGRFEEDVDKSVESFLAGKDIIYDTELIPYDIYGTVAHNLMLHKIGAISDEEVKPILGALKKIYVSWQKGEFQLTQELEDVHMNIENIVTEQIGPEVGGKMHLARSRNDQVLLDLHLFMRDEIITIQKYIFKLLEVLIKKAEDNLETLFIGYTHLQQAQPITFAHWCMAYVDTLFRDLDRLSHTYQKINVNPLGAGAIAGTSWPIDRQYTTDLLGFDAIQENTLDVISSRGEFEAELVSNFTFIMMHLGRMAEDLILGATSEFGYIILSDKYSTGSSIMPQKKNPDVLELIRSKVGVMNGKLMILLGILKGLPSGYNRDHQELKGALFSSIENMKLTIQVLTGLIATVKLNKEKIQNQIKNNFIMATELVDLLIKEYQIPFRTSYTIIGNLVKDFTKQNKKPEEITPEILIDYVKNNTPQKILISTEKIKKALDPLETIKRRVHIGGPAPKEEQRMIESRKKKLEIEKEQILTNEKKNKKAFNDLMYLIDNL